MSQIRLDDRLSSIVSFVGKGEIVADIGTDHGLVPNYLYENKISPRVYATDISKMSLEKNKEFTELRANESGVISLHGNGIQPLLEYDLDTIILAGMGGDLIIDILNRDLDYIRSKKLIIQPQTSSVKVRRFLNSINFAIIEEKIAKVNDHYYEIIHGEYRKTIKTKNDYFGHNLVSSCDQALLEYIDKKRESVLNTLNLIEDLDSDQAQKRKDNLLKELALYQEVLDDCKSKGYS